MARVRDIEPDELAPDLAAIYREFAGACGPFRNQVAVFAHVPAALRHLMGLLLELRATATLPKRYLELAIVTVSKLNACEYCVAHHTPFLAVEGVSPSGAERLLDYVDHPELDDTDRLVVEYAIAAWEHPNRIPDSLFDRLRAQLQAAMNRDSYQMHWDKGKVLTFSSITAYLYQEFRAGSDAGAEASPQRLLTAREQEILGLMAAGMTNPQIAMQLVIGAGTVKTHTLNIYRKLDVANRTQAIVRAQEWELLQA